MYEVIMPKLGITMESGRIEKWHKKEGDRVEKGEVLFDVMTDKVTIEVESYNSGLLKKILKAEGEEVPVTEVIAYIGEEDEKVPPHKSDQKTAERVTGMETKEAEKKISSIKEDVEISGDRVKISPLARKIAEEIGIDYRSGKIKGSGPGGRIVKEDVMAYSKQKEGNGKKEAESASAGITIKSSVRLEGKRKIIADRMSYSALNIPEIVLNVKANVTRLKALREELNEKILKTSGVRITYTDFLLKAASNAIRNNLELNSTFSDGNYIIYDDINIGLAVSSDGGLIVPTIFNCDRLKITDIAKKRIELINKAKEEKLNLEDISNGTFTVTNLGMYGIRSFSPIINPPQAAILAVGEIYTEPAVIDGKIRPESFMNLTVSCDHRIIDGTTGAKFLRELVEFIENPAGLID
ncbi:MAG TPA: dihydrolipoamide acetyltransferase family protein [Candidatus Humimicrobiaceae bacterium]